MHGRLNSSMVLVVVILLFFGAHTPHTCHAEEEGRPFFVDLIQTDARLFNAQISRFTPTRNEELLQQYFVSNLRRNDSMPGAFIEIVEMYRSEILAGTDDERLDLLTSWTDQLEEKGELPSNMIDLGQFYLSIRRLASTRDRLEPDNSDAQRLVHDMKKYVGANEQDPWGVFFQALAGQALRIRGLEPGFSSPPLALVAKASMLASQDGHLHYILGHLYSHIIDEDDVHTYVRLVTSEFEKALLLQPSNRELFTRITGIYVDIHERFQSRGAAEPFWFEELVYKRIIALDPTNAHAHNNLSFLYSSHGVNLQQALREARIANQLDPDNPAILDTLGWAYYRNGMLQEALQALSRAAELDPTLPDVHFHLASVYYDLNDFEPTVHHFREAIRLDPYNAFALNNLAYFFAENDRNLEEALELVTRALAIHPDNAAFLDTKGWVLYRQGRIDEALPYIRRAVALSPETSELHLHLGQILLDQHKIAEAIESFEHALAYDPENRAVARRLSHLFALQALQNTKRTYRRIAGVTSDKENLKIFYDLMAQIHQADGNYHRAAEVLHEYHELRPDPPSKPDDMDLEEPDFDIDDEDFDVEIDELMSADPYDPILGALVEELDDGAVWSSLSSLLPPSSDLLFGLSQDGVTTLVDLALENIKTPVPAHLLRPLLISRIPHRALLGVSVAGHHDPHTATIVLAMNPRHGVAFARRLKDLAGSSLQIPGLDVPIDFSERRYRDMPVGRIALATGAAHYLVVSPRIVVFSLDRSHLIRLADTLADDETPHGPPLLTSSAWKDFASWLATNRHHAFSYLSMASEERLAVIPPLAHYEELMKAVASSASAYVVHDSDDVVTERAFVTPSTDTELETLRELVNDAVVRLKRTIRQRTNDSVSVDSTIEVRSNRIHGSTNFKGVLSWLGGFLSNIEIRTAPEEDGLDP